MNYSENTSSIDEPAILTERRITLSQRIRRLIRVALVVGTFSVGGQGLNLYNRAQEIEKSKITIDNLSSDAKDLFTITDKFPSNQSSSETEMKQTPQITEGDVDDLKTLAQQMLDKLNELPRYELGSIGDRLPHQLPVTEQKISELKVELQSLLDQLNKIRDKYKDNWDKQAAGTDFTNLTETFQHILDFQKGIQETVDSSQGQYSPEVVEMLKALARFLELIATALVSVGLGMIAFRGNGSEEKRKIGASDGEKNKREPLRLEDDGEIPNIATAYQDAKPATLEEVLDHSAPTDHGSEELDPNSLYAKIDREQKARNRAFGNPSSSK